MQDLGVAHAFLTPSATAALEMCALSSDLQHGDEVIMPSFAFTSCANAIVLRGAVPVFVDVRPDTLNLDETLVHEAISERTKAVLMLHYAGVCCEADAISSFARNHGLLVIEDAAQAYLSRYKGRMAGSLGDMAALSFHGTKNVRCGEGGAFLTGSSDIAERAAIFREKGTDRSKFLRGKVHAYTWVDVGSSYLPSEFQAAVLLAELERAMEITRVRMALWNAYHEAFADLEQRELLVRPAIPADCAHNAHIYHIRLPDERRRDDLLDGLRREGIGATFHFLPLHLSRAGQRFGRAVGELPVTQSASARLLRLPLGSTTTMTEVERTISLVKSLL
jgi:dTDP-4-amino-4,6-dideoxygalactose transaminase